MTKHTLARTGTLAITVIMLLSLLLTALIPLRTQAAEDSGGTVVIDVEKFTLGQGWLIEPVQFEYTEGENVAQVLDRFLKENGYTYNNTGSLTAAFYLAGINNADTGDVSVPAYITEMSGGTVTTESVRDYGGAGDGSLNEMDYNSMSGWYYFVNNVAPNVGMDSWIPKDGDVIRIQFTLWGYGADLTGTLYGEDEPRVVLSDKDNALTALAEVNSAANKEELLADSAIKQAYDNLKEMVTDAAVPQADLDAACDALYEAVHGTPIVHPDSITLDTTDKTLYTDSGSFTLTATVQPENATDKSVAWSSGNPSVAFVDNSGTVTPRSAGTAVVTATTENGLTAECTVTVLSRPITAINLNAEALQLAVDSTAQLNATLLPSNTTDSKDISWTSDNPSVATVEDGQVTGIASGSAVITATAANGLTATCQVTVAEDNTALAQAVADAIASLPDSGSLTLADKAAVMSAKASYDALPEAAKALMDAAAVSKLDNAVAVMTALAADQSTVQQFEEALAMLLEVDKIGAGDNNAVKTLVNLCNTYDALTDAQQQALSDTAKTKVDAIMDKQDVLKAAVEAVNRQVDRLKPTDGLGFNDAETVAEALDAYNGLCAFLRDEEDVKPGWINADAYSTLVEANQQIKFLYTTAINGLDTTDLDLGAATTADFIEAVMQYEATPEASRPVLSESTTQRMEAGKTAIAALAHTDGDLSATNLPWHVQLIVTEANATSGLEEDVTQAFGDGSQIRALYNVVLVDLSTGNAYESSDNIGMTLIYAVEDGDDTAQYKLFRANPSALGILSALSGDTGFAEIEGFTYNGSLFNFDTTLPAVVGVAYASVPITGIAITSSGTSVAQGSTIQLSASPIPDNATLGDAGLEVTWSSSDTNVATVDSNGLVTGKRADGSATITAQLADDPSITGSVTITVEASAAVQDLRDSLNPSLNTMLQQTSNYVVSLQLATEAASAGNIGYSSVWEVIGAARAREIAASAGIDTSQYDTFLNTWYNNVGGNYRDAGGMIDTNLDGNEDNDARNKKTEYSRLILGMTAIGKDARNIEGYNIFDHLRDMDAITRQGINGPTWVLIAYKCSDAYADELPATDEEARQRYPDIENPVSEEGLVEYLLNHQIGDGGWVLNEGIGSSSETDITAMTMQALWPYYSKPASERSATENKYANQVAAAITRGMNRLTQLQTDNGAFTTINGSALVETSESTVQVIVAATMLGLDPADASNGLIKGNNQWALSAMTQYYSDGSRVDDGDRLYGFEGVPGGFAHTIGNAADDGSGAAPGTRNGIATQQGFYSLVAYKRLVEGKNGLYDMSEEPLTAGTGASGFVNATVPSGTGASGTSVRGTSAGGSTAAPAAQQSTDGWSFDAAMASPDNGGMNEQMMQIASGVLGGIAIAIVVVYSVILAISRYKNKLL